MRRKERCQGWGWALHTAIHVGVNLARHDVKYIDYVRWSVFQLGTGEDEVIGGI
jgi:hypothetical protein